MARRTRADIQADLDSILIDTAAQGTITPSVIKGLLTDILDSSVVQATDTNLSGLTPWNAGIQYYTGMIVQYNYRWYQAAVDPALDGVFHTNDWTLLGYVEYAKRVTIPTASVLALNTTPYTLIASIAAHTIRVNHISAKMVYNSIAYTTNTDLVVKTSGASTNHCLISSFLAGTASKYKVAETLESDLISATDVVAFVPAGDPAAGNSDITIELLYNVV